MESPPDIIPDFYIVGTVDTSYIVTEEQALTALNQYRRGELILEFDGIEGAKIFVVSQKLVCIEESSPAIRKYRTEHNEMITSEKGYKE